MATQQELDERFVYHPPTPEQIPLYEEQRAKFRELMQWVVENTPDSKEQNEAIDYLDLALMKANSAIARHS